jgi:hypothetical protein
VEGEVVSVAFDIQCAREVALQTMSLERSILLREISDPPLILVNKTVAVRVSRNEFALHEGNLVESRSQPLSSFTWRSNSGAGAGTTRSPCHSDHGTALARSSRCSATGGC